MEVLYICDRRACERCRKECKHTRDVRHAANFQASECAPGMMVEQEEACGGIVTLPVETISTNDNEHVVCATVAIVLSLLAILVFVVLPL